MLENAGLSPPLAGLSPPLADLSQCEALAQCETRPSRQREVVQLEWAHWTAKERVRHANRSLSKAQADGFRFERMVGGYLQQRLGAVVRCGPWIEFVDINGLGLAQPDIVLCLPTSTVVFEAKLTYRNSAWDQLRLLYKPLLGMLRPGRPVVCVQVCKHLMPVMADERVVSNLAECSDGAVWFVPQKLVHNRGAQ